MTHDAVKQAARERMARTGESYTAARRAVIAEHAAKQAAEQAEEEATDG